MASGFVDEHFAFYIDNVSVTAPAVPEPATLLMVALATATSLPFAPPRLITDPQASRCDDASPEAEGCRVRVRDAPPMTPAPRDSPAGVVAQCRDA
jgi:hypothetical protein